MKISVTICVRSNCGDRGIVNEFCERFPFGRQGMAFEARLPQGDPRLTEVLEAVKARGIPQADYSKRERPKFEYRLECHRTYESEDFDSARYLKLKHEVLISEDQERDKAGRLQIQAKLLRPGIQIGCVLFNATVVSGALRERMVEASLQGLEFAEIVAVGQEGAEVSRQFWELRSSVILPPMPPERVIRHRNLPNDDVHVAGIRDGDYFDKEIHYGEDSIKRLEPFDFALTHEIFGAENWEKMPGERWPVASQRFRQFCLAQKLKLSWVPVRIDPD